MHFKKLPSFRRPDTKEKKTKTQRADTRAVTQPYRKRLKKKITVNEIM